jgi:hypothetical protein
MVAPAKKEFSRKIALPDTNEEIFWAFSPCQNKQV